MKFPRALALLLLASPLAAVHSASAQNVYGQSDELIPAGSLIHCTLDEKLSSKTIAVGDPVMCQVSHSELYGRSTIPFGSYLVGRFADYKDPGHFVGKGWVELKFDRLVIKPDTVLPVNARVIEVPKYPVDDQGRIHGTGHTTRDIVEWSIPILWPIDLLELPRRGPRVVLKPETQLTLRVMDDLGIPTPQDTTYRQPALVARSQPNYNDQYQQPQQYAPAPIVQGYAQQPYQQYAPVQAAPQTIIYNNYAPPQQYAQPQQQQQTVVVQSAPQPRYAPRPVYVTPPPPPPYGYGPYGYRGYYPPPY